MLFIRLTRYLKEAGCHSNIIGDAAFIVATSLPAHIVHLIFRVFLLLYRRHSHQTSIDSPDRCSHFHRDPLQHGAAEGDTAAQCLPDVYGNGFHHWGN